MGALEGLGLFPHTRARFLEYQRRRPPSQFFYKIDIHDSPIYRFNQYVLDKDGLKRINQDAIGRVQSSTLKEPEDWTKVAPEMKRIRPAYGKQLNDEQNRREALPDHGELFESIASSGVKSPEEKNSSEISLLDTYN